MATASTKTVYKCPQCGGSLMQSKDKLVCITDGWSTTVAAFVPKALPPDPAPARAAQEAAQAKPFVAIPLPKPAVPAVPMVEPNVDKKLVAKRKLAKVVGNKQVAEAQAKIDQAKGTAQTFADTYRAELKELLPGETGKYLKLIGMIFFGIFILTLILTLHLVPGL
jgi:hypothetical protein